MAVVKLRDTRLAFAQIFEAKAINDGKPRYSAKFIIEPGSKNDKMIREAVAEVSKEKWKDKTDIIMADINKKDNNTYRLDEYRNKSGEVYGGFEGMYNIGASRAEKQGRPEIYDRDRTPLIEKDGKIYSGCYVNANLDIWAEDDQYGRKINAKIIGIQFSKDGQAFTGGVTMSKDDFDDLTVADGEELA